MVTHNLFRLSPRSAIFCALASLFCLSACDKREAPAPIRQGQNTRAHEEAPIIPQGPAPNAIQVESLGDNSPLPPQKAGRKVALLLPLSGQHSALGQSMQQAAEMALFEKADEHLEIEILDTQSTPQGAKNAAEKALASGCPMILGPIFGDDVKAVAPIARRQNVPVISFSNNPQIAGNGVFVIGLAPEEQIQAVVRYAQSQGSKAIVALLPRNSYGELMAQEVSRLKAGGAPITDIIYYSEEGGSSLKKTLDPLSSTPFDTLLIPEGGDALVPMVQALKDIGVNLNQKRILGSTQWDEVDLHTVKELQGALIASPDLTKRRPFEAQFKTTYGSIPPKIASLAYDGVAMMAILNKHFPQNPYAYSTLTQSRGFTGIDGVFRLKGDGRCERKLSIVKATPQGFVTVEGGGRSF